MNEGMDSRLVIDVTRIGRDGEELSGVLDDAVLELTGDLVRPFGGIRYELGAMLFGRELLVRGKLAQDFDAVCSRCGKDFDFTVKVDDFTTSIAVDDKTIEVDLTEELRESVLIELPNYPVCRADCPGIAVESGEGADARWSALDGLALPSAAKAKKTAKSRKPANHHTT